MVSLGEQVAKRRELMGAWEQDWAHDGVDMDGRRDIAVLGWRWMYWGLGCMECFVKQWELPSGCGANFVLTGKEDETMRGDLWRG